MRKRCGCEGLGIPAIQDPCGGLWSWREADGECARPIARRRMSLAIRERAEGRCHCGR